MGNKVHHGYLQFSRKEGIAIIALLMILVPLALLPLLGKYWNGQIGRQTDTQDEKEWFVMPEQIDNQQNSSRESYAKPNYYQRKTVSYSKEKAPVGRLFNFDPNTASSEQLKALGLRDKTISILSNYRNKGGKFRKPEDLQKVYGLQPQEFERLKPYIVIAEGHKTIEYKEFSHQKPAASYTKTEYKKKAVVIDVNTADTTAFQSLYGIGSKLAARIINFRNKLGGFYTIEQVGETYGVTDSTFLKIRPFLVLGSHDVLQLDLNQATYNELNAHPYIGSKLAYSIMKYRKDHGAFTNWDAVKELVAQTDDSYEKVQHYVRID